MTDDKVVFIRGTMLDPHGMHVRTTQMPARKKLGHCCRHLDMQVCSEQRTIECGVCGAVLDPFDCMERLTFEWDKLALRMDYLKREVRELTEKRDALKREVNNAKAAIRRAKR